MLILEDGRMTSSSHHCSHVDTAILFQCVKEEEGDTRLRVCSSRVERSG